MSQVPDHLREPLYPGNTVRFTVPAIRIDGVDHVPTGFDVKATYPENDSKGRDLSHELRDGAIHVVVVPRKPGLLTVVIHATAPGVEGTSRTVLRVQPT